MNSLPIAKTEMDDLKKRVVKEAAALVAEWEISKRQKLAEFAEASEIAGILKINPKTLEKIPRTKLPRYWIAPGLIRYKWAEFEQFIKSTREA